MRFHRALLFLFACAAMPSAQASAQAALTPAAKTAPAQQASIVYRNTQYGFCFVLPASWKGYTIVSEEWRGTILSSGQVVHGPQLLIRNPKWTEENQYQDIFIMVFTPEQWQKVDDAEISVSAAPIGPQELGHNNRYVFALPPRWIGYADVLGWEDLETWMQQNRLQAPCTKSSTGPAK
ncbi:MAG: hypothetical protein ABSE53_10785 [Terracidiphilus sp.]